MSTPTSETRDGMQIDWDVPVTMDDGVVLRADVFRPVGSGRFPPLLTYGPYAKGLAFQEGYPSAWQRMAEQHPDVTAGSTDPTSTQSARVATPTWRYSSGVSATPSSTPEAAALAGITV